MPVEETAWVKNDRLGHRGEGWQNHHKMPVQRASLSLYWII